MSNQITKKFADNLQDLISDSKKSIKDLAKEIGIPSGSLSKYQNDNAEPGIENFTKIAKYFNVSTDFLLGLTDVKSTDLDIRDISEKTGLSEESIYNLKRVFNHAPSKEVVQSKYLVAHNYRYILNPILESEFLGQFVHEAEILSRQYTALRDIYRSDEEYQESKNKHAKETEEFNFHVYQLQEITKDLIIRIIEERYIASIPKDKHEKFLAENPGYTKNDSEKI